MSLARDPITGAFITKPPVQIAPSENAAAANSAAGRVVTTVPSLKLATGVNIDSSLSSKLAVLDVTPSTTPQPGKAVVATDTGSVIGINRLTCSSLKINGVLLDTSIFASASASSDDINNPLLQVTPGVASAGKALTLNNEMSISGLKQIKVNQISNGSRKLIPPSGILIPRLIDSKICHPKDVLMLNALNSATNSTSWLNDRNTITTGTGSKYSVFSKRLNRYVSVYDSQLLTSIDGHHWVSVYTASLFNSLRYFSIPSQIDIFIAITNSQIVYSTDGLNWTPLSVPHASTTTNYMNDITYSHALGKFLIVGSHTSYLFSPSDIFTPDLWTIGEYYNVGLRTVVYAAFCDYFFAITTNNDIHTLRSRNGLTWTICPDQVGTRNVASNLCSIAVSEELGIVVAGYNQAINTYNHMRYTRNGVDWFACATSTYGKIVNIQWTPQLFMFTALMLGGNYSYSLNGIEWFTQYNGSVSTTGGMINYSEALDCLTIRLDAAYSKTYSVGGKSTASNKLDLDQENARVGLGIAAHAQSALSLGGNGSKMIKMRDVLDIFTPEVYLENNQLTFKATALVVNPSRTSGYAVKLNGVAINSSFWSTAQDKIIGLSSANTAVNKLAITQIDQSLQGFISVDSLTVNNQPVDTAALASQSDSRLPSVLGVAETGKVLTHKSGKVVLTKAKLSSLNTASSKIRNLSSYYTTPANTPNVTINNIAQPYVASLDFTRTFDTIVNALTYTTITGGAVSDLYCYVDHLGLFITARTNSSSYTLIRPRSTGVSINFPYSIGTINAVFYSPEFKRVYVSGSTYTISSTNLTTWERVQMASTAVLTDMAYSPELCLAIAGSTSGMWWTRDGVMFALTNSIIGTAQCSPFWSAEWGMFVVANRGSTYSRPVVSNDGFNWRHLDISQRSLDYSITSVTRFAYSPKLQMLVAISSSLVYVSKDAVNFTVVSNVSSATDVKWIPELEVFIATTSSSSAAYYFSKDGCNWILTPPPNASLYGSMSGIFYNKALGGLMWANSTTGGSATLSSCVKNFEAYDTSAVLCETENIVVDNVNSRVGIGKAPDYTLELSMDLAFKPATNTWATSSDARLKEDIQPADVSICRQVVDTIPLKHYRWKREQIQVPTGGLLDDSQLGWIAQDVEQVLPKCVTSKDRLGLSDCRDLNSDQLIAHMWGALQSIIYDVEELQAASI